MIDGGLTTVEWRATVRWRGGGNSGGSTVGVASTSKNHHSHLNSVSSNRAEKLYEHLIPARRSLFIPFLRTKSLMGQTKNRSSEKSHKKTNRTNKISTNFV